MIRKIASIAIVACMPWVTSAGGCTIDSQDPASQGASSSGKGGEGGAAASSGAGGGSPEGGVASRCTASEIDVSCTHEQKTVPGEGGVPRDVIWQVPLGTPPVNGWPVVLLFQGSFFGPLLMFDGHKSDMFGRYYVALTVKELLDAGYAVLAPAAHANGAGYWDTNIPPWSIDWTNAPDNAFMLSIFQAIAAGKFGPLDASRLYAAGISSGGYMTSRMAVSYAGKFKALAIHSASYATCSAVCVVPTPLPSDHPPTLFLHGEVDPIVPIDTMKAYDDRLISEGKETRVATDPKAGHEWLAVGPNEVVTWFNTHP